MTWMVPAAFFVAAAAATAVATRILIPRLERSRVLDQPNARSSHRTPTPRGAGLAVVPIAAAVWMAAALVAPGGDAAFVWAAIGALALCAVSWIDDLRGLAPLLRLAGHAIVVAALLARLPAEVLHFQGLLPLWADRLAAAATWLWFINLFNFMDGIDGIAGVETLAIGAGIALVSIIALDVADLAVAGATLAGAAAGFLLWNWHPARVFLGDAGSVPLGLMLGWLLLDLAGRGLWAPALILPLYYLADATLTLVRRAARGEKIWQAHREHFYQQAVQRGLAHDRVVLLVGGADAGLIALAALSLISLWPALVGGALLTAGLLAILRGRAPMRRTAP
jgi:UDP-N-acetylmuramyl pentapeptide phosphotransferase/UDP-N-acetylglucosamine-1-phosphate transferase